MAGEAETPGGGRRPSFSDQLSTLGNLVVFVVLGLAVAAACVAWELWR